MRPFPDLTIGQKLGVGFGLYLLLLAGVLGAFFTWHAAGAKAQQEYAARIVPLREALFAAERGIYAVAITARSVVIEPGPERTAEFERSMAVARSTIDALGEQARAADIGADYRQIREHATSYLQSAIDFVAQTNDGAVGGADEISMVRARTLLLDDMHEFSLIRSAAAAASLAAITATREQTTRGLLVLSLFTGLLVGLLGWFTSRAIARPTQSLLRTVAALEAGDWTPALSLAPASGAVPATPVRNEMRRLSNAFGTAAVALESREQRMRADGAVARAVASHLDRHALAEHVLADVVGHLRAEVGVLYSLAAGTARLVPIACHALADSLPSIEIGEGIPGQAARSRRMVVVTDVPADCGLQVRLGSDQALPASIVAIPLLFRNELHGVLLAASLRVLDEDALAFLEASATQLGIGLHNASTHEEVQRLLSELREKSASIQSQYEDLQVQNEEIQAQNEEIQSQSQQLQVQHEEMQAQNEELLQQSNELRLNAELLAEADERKNTFLGVLAHELRNPMAPIVNGIHILKHSPPGSHHALSAQAVIERQAAHLVRLIDDLLDITRISEGKVNISRVRLDLADIVRASVEDLATGFEQSGIAVSVNLPANPVHVDGDHTRLCQVLGNLLNNSLKFCDRGGHVTVSLEVDQAQRCARLAVADDGIGIDHELLPRLFHPFSQGFSGLARTNGGLGLGLALVRTLVTLHDGAVEAHSDGQGRGAVFTLQLPLSAHSTVGASEAPAAELTRGGPKPRRRVLIIEDNVDAAATLRDALLMDGFQVEVAHSGLEGVSMARVLRPEIVLCDIGLPDQDGYEVARILSKAPELTSTLLVALTGYASTDDRERAQDAGFDFHLAKPLRVDRLPEIIDGMHSRRRERMPEDATDRGPA
jgi:signal transduction histidine kinase/ActR/RegA family two-component response regulator/HAMP domain-containing protein